MTVQEALDIVEYGVGFVSSAKHAEASCVLAEEVKRLQIRVKELESSIIK